MTEFRNEISIDLRRKTRMIFSNAVHQVWDEGMMEGGSLDDTTTSDEISQYISYGPQHGAFRTIT
jgi:hypothetical protein